MHNYPTAPCVSAIVPFHHYAKVSPGSGGLVLVCALDNCCFMNALHVDIGSLLFPMGEGSHVCRTGDFVCYPYFRGAQLTHPRFELLMLVLSFDQCVCPIQWHVVLWSISRLSKRANSGGCWFPPCGWSQKCCVAQHASWWFSNFARYMFLQTMFAFECFWIIFRIPFDTQDSMRYST